MIAVLGAFDGFHRGHAALLERAAMMAERCGTDWGAVTFEPPPGLFFGAFSATLFTLQERRLLSVYLRMPHFIVLTFDEVLADSSPMKFWRILRRQANIDGIVVGRDFHFGRGREGDADLLNDYCRVIGLQFAVVDLRMDGGVKISSSTIRDAVSNGDCRLAAHQLGYPYFIVANVEHGFGRGRTLGFPTANLDVPQGKLLPAEGVYAVAAAVDGQWYAGALSIGVNPTFHDVRSVSTEMFLLDYTGDLYGTRLPVLFLEYLRPMIRFEGPEALREQLTGDMKKVRRIFNGAINDNKTLYADFIKSYNKLDVKN